MSAVDEVVEQEGHFRLSCHLGDHPADQLIWLQQLCCHTLLPKTVYQIVGHLHSSRQEHYHHAHGLSMMRLLTFDRNWLPDNRAEDNLLSERSCVIDVCRASTKHCKA